jgi:hypothetical protein
VNLKGNIMHKKSILFLNGNRGSVLIMVTIFTLIFSILALLTMRVAVLQNANKLREYNISRTFYAADATTEYAAWLMSWITRGDAMTQAELNTPASITGNGRKRPRFPEESNESIIGVGGTGSQTAGGQTIFGTISATAGRRNIPFDTMASFDNPAITVPVWFPMVNRVFYRFDALDTQQPQVDVHCRVEREDVSAGMTIVRQPRPIDGYMPAVNIPGSNFQNSVSSFYSPGRFNNQPFYLYRITWPTEFWYLLVPSNSAHTANINNFLGIVNDNLQELIYDVRYYVIITEAKATDATSPNHPFTSTVRFHYAVTDSQVRQQLLTAANLNTFFAVETIIPIPSNFGVNLSNYTMYRFTHQALSNLYAPRRFHSVFRSRR